MPGFVIHLSAANKFLENNQIEDKQEFYKGVIAPDFTDDKSKTHYGLSSSKPHLDKYLSDNKLNSSFNKGYFLHLVTDYLFYNKFLTCFSKKYIYNDYDILNGFLMDKYKVILPEEVKDKVFFNEGDLKLLNKEEVVKFIDQFENIDLEKIECEIKNNNPEGKWDTFAILKHI